MEQTIIKRKKINLSDEIAVESYINGRLIYSNPRTGRTWKWSKLGDIVYLPYEELLVMQAELSKFIDAPWVIIKDKDVVENLGLTEFYKTTFKPKDISTYLDPAGSRAELISFIESATPATISLFVDLVKKQIEERTLKDWTVISTIMETINKNRPELTKVDFISFLYPKTEIKTETE